MLESYRNLFEPLSYLDLTLWFLAIFISFLILFYTLYKFKTKSTEIKHLQKLNIITWIVFYFLIGIACILNITWRYFISNDLLSNLLENLTNLLYEIAFLSKIVFTEYSINRYKFYKGYYFSIIFCFLITLTMILPEPVGKEMEIIDVFYIGLFSLGVLLFPILFLYIAFKVKGDERKMALKITFGYTILIIGILFQPQNFDFLQPFITNFELFSNFFLILCPILLLWGSIIMFSSYRNIFKSSLRDINLEE